MGLDLQCYRGIRHPGSRLSFNGRFITFEGRSYRLLKKHKTG